MEKGSTYASKKPKEKRPKDDLYHSPFSLTWELLKVEELENVLEPADGKGAISKVLRKEGIKVFTSDIQRGRDFLKRSPKQWNGDIVTNPPFSLWDDFLLKAKSLNPRKICFIGKLNFFGTHSRNDGNFWKGLKYIYVFDRMVDYQTPYREDGQFHVGSLVTGWFVFYRGYRGDPKIKIIDVQQYATLGAFKKRKTKKL